MKTDNSNIILEELKMLDTFFNTIPDFINVQDKNQRIIRLNKSFSDFHGITPEKAKGMHCYELLGRANKCSVCAVKKSFGSKKMEYVRLFMPEWNKWVDNYAYPVLDKQGEVEVVFEHFHDVTKEVEGLRQQEDNRWLHKHNDLAGSLFLQSETIDDLLRNTANLLSVILKLSLVRISSPFQRGVIHPDSIITNANAGNREIQLLNDQYPALSNWLFKHMLARQQGELVIMSEIEEDKDNEILENSEGFYACLPLISDSNESWLMELYSVNKDFKLGEIQKKFLTILSLRLSQAIEKLQLLDKLKQQEKKLNDYSAELKKTVSIRTFELEDKALRLEKTQKALAFLSEDMNDIQQELQEVNDKLIAANKELESFSYSVSHDLNAPLVRMSGFSKMLLDKYGNKLDEEGWHYLVRIEASAKNMSNLINAILDLSRVNRTEISLRKVNISLICKRIFKEICGEDDHETQFEVDDEIFVVADPSLITVLLRNLLHNSYKFTRKVSKPLIKVNSKTVDKKSVIVIEDNGAGFDMGKYDALFTPFRRLHGQDQFPGSGIGLATVYRIIKRHKGEIWAESVINKGSKFYIKL